MASDKLRFAFLNYDGGAPLAQAQRDQVVALAPKYLIHNDRFPQDAIYFMGALPNCRHGFYKSLSDDSPTHPITTYLAAHLADPEEQYLHFIDDTNVVIRGTTFLVKGWPGGVAGATGTAATKAEARIPVYETDRSRLAANYSTTTVRAARKAWLMQQAQTAVSTGLYWSAVMYDNSMSDYWNVDLAGSQPNANFGRVLEDPAHNRINTRASFDWSWYQGMGLYLKEVRQYIDAGAPELAGRPFELVPNHVNIPAASGNNPSWRNRYVDQGTTPAPANHCGHVAFCEWQFSQYRNDGANLPRIIFDNLKAANDAGMKVWDPGYYGRYGGLTYPNGTMPNNNAGNVSLNANEALISRLAMHLLIRSSGTHMTPYPHEYAVGPTNDGTTIRHNDWQHNTWPLFTLDPGAAQEEPFLLQSGTDGLNQFYQCWARRMDNSLTLVRQLYTWNDSCAAGSVATITLPAGRWQPVLDASGTLGAETTTWPLKATSGQVFMRVGVAPPPPDTTAPSTVTDLTASAPTQTGATLTWTAPGDDGATGQATSYEVRRHTAPVTALNWASATPVAGAPAPALSGTVQTMTVANLTAGTLYYFALITTDEAGNVSGVSNSPSVTTLPLPDTTAPSRVTDLAIIAASQTDLTARWTAPGDDFGVGTAAAYDIRFATQPIIESPTVPVVVNGSLYPSHTAAVAANFFQDIGNNDPATVATLALAAGENTPILHFVPPCTALYAACLSAICGGYYQLTTVGGPANRWLETTITAGAPDGAFGAPTAAAVISGTLASRTFARATVYANLSLVASVACGPAPGGVLAPGGAYIATGVGYGSSNVDGMFPQRGGIFWDTTTAAHLAAIAVWKVWIGNNSQTEGPTEGVNSPTPVASWRAARAAAVPSNPNGKFYESHNGLGVFDNGGTGPSAYWPQQQRTFAFCEAFAETAWILEDHVPMTVSSGANTVRLFNVTHPGLREFLANEFLASAARCGADGIFGDEWHAIHPLEGALHPGVPTEAYQTAAMVALGALLSGGSNLFTDCTPVGSPVTPAVAGTVQTQSVGPLAFPGLEYWVALRARDENSNWSRVSNVVSGVTALPTDIWSPTTISSLAVTGHSNSTVSLSWQAPQDEVGGVTYPPATAYDVRYSTSPINSGNFAAAAVAPGAPAPGVYLSAQGMTITGLASSTLYYFAIKSRDAAGNWSAISNVVSVTTSAGATTDTTAPSAVADLSLVGTRTTSSLTVTWTAPGDDAGVGTAAQFDLRYSTAAIDAGNFAAALQVAGEPAPAAPGTVQSMVVTGLVPATTYYFAIKTADEVPNWSAISNVPSRATLPIPPDTAPPGDTTDLAATVVGPTSVELSWTAPGDDGTAGTATVYDVRRSADSITPFTFASNTPVTGAPAPGVAGTRQTMVVSGLTPRTVYNFALRTGDEAGNYSGLSNVAVVTTPSPNRYRMRVECTNRLRLRVEV